MSGAGPGYHLSELEIARSPRDPRRVLPEIPPACRRVLDIGCGMGQTIMACDLPDTVVACGVDRERDALQLGRARDAAIRFICADGEALPLPDGWADFVIARISLPYMHMPSALREIRRVLRPGGGAWMVLHPWHAALAHLWRSLRERRLRDAAFRIYVLLNGILFHVAGGQLRLPMGRRRCESFQTPRAMRRALRRHGFRQIHVDRERFFVVRAS